MDENFRKNTPPGAVLRDDIKKIRLFGALSCLISFIGFTLSSPVSVFSIKFFYPACCIHKPLFPGKKPVTVGANLNFDVLPGGFCVDDIAAYTGNGCFFIVWMNSFFHLSAFLLFTCSSSLRNRHCSSYPVPFQ